MLECCVSYSSTILVESRDLIKNILQKDPTKRLTIPQILTHSWFTTCIPSYRPESPIGTILPVHKPSGSPSSDHTSQPHTEASAPDSQRSSEASTLSASSDITFLSGPSEFGSYTPPTPDDLPDDPFELGGPDKIHHYSTTVHRNPSEATLKKTVAQQADLESLRSKMGRPGPETVLEEEQNDTIELTRPPLLRRAGSSAGSGTKPPPVNPARTPVRTKRRSVSSILSDPASPTEKSPSPLPSQSQDLDFASLLSTPTPIIFSTPLERQLLNTLSLLGFDMGQIVHSVLSNACDAAGALWWMLRRKAEKKGVEESGQSGTVPTVDMRERGSRGNGELEEGREKVNTRVAIAVQTDPSGMHLSLARSAPQLAFVPPTPTNARPSTPPRPVTPTRSPMLSPSSSTAGGDSSSRSLLSTPSSSFKDREASKGRKTRSGSVSIMQRATTALEAAGLVRKKSSEAVRDEKEKDREREREKSKEIERRIASGEEPRNSHGSSSSKLTKSPPLKSSKEYTTPSTPPPNKLHHPQPQMGSPWVLTDSRDFTPHYTRASAPTPANSPGDMASMSTPNFAENLHGKGTAGPHRNRANLLTAFRLWFHEDRKGKRKETIASTSAYNRPFANSSQPFNNGSVKRRTSASGSKFASRAGGHRAQRPSASSRRSSSVNSRRSSGTSVQLIMLDSPPVATRRSFGTHTPNSERGDFSSRPSSIRSFSMQRHRKSPSASSAGSTHFRTASPMQKYHRRTGSGSSTRVVRQVQTTRPAHMRSGSTTSSIHSPTSSRPASYYEPSESEGPRNISPLKPRPRRSADDRGVRQNTSNTTFVAQKRSGPFTSPVAHSYGNSTGRTSWKKSWGLEPPGWQTRTAHLPIKVLSISPASESPSIRDVFSGRHSLSPGDESDWVDEDDDIPAFAGGLGQMATSVSSPSALAHHVVESTVTLSPAPRGHRSTKRVNRNAGPPSGTLSTATARQKSGLSPVERTSPVPMDNAYETPETRGGRRQLPAARSGPAFRGHAIQEEDEGEEE